jgi:hypothetical protein
MSLVGLDDPNVKATVVLMGMAVIAPAVHVQDG